MLIDCNCHHHDLVAAGNVIFPLSLLGSGIYAPRHFSTLLEVEGRAFVDCEIHITITVWDGACGGVHIRPVRYFVDWFDVIAHG